MDVAEARRLKELESENEKLKRLAAEQLPVIDGLKAACTAIAHSASAHRVSVRARESPCRLGCAGAAPPQPWILHAFPK